MTGSLFLKIGLIAYCTDTVGSRLVVLSYVCAPYATRGNCTKKDLCYTATL